jgi:hypothetical protein
LYSSPTGLENTVTMFIRLLPYADILTIQSPPRSL